jgi:hypothetical protein
VEMPNEADVDLAAYAFNQVLNRVSELQALWLKLHNDACTASRIAMLQQTELK